MKKTAKGIWSTIQWILAAILGLATIGASMDNFGAGICMLVATVMICPWSRHKIVDLIWGAKKTASGSAARKSSKKTAANGLCGVLAAVFLVAGSGAISEEPASGDSGTIAATESIQASVESVVQSTETLPLSMESASQSSETDSMLAEPTSQSAESPALTTASDIRSTEPGSSPLLEVHFIDVGQGDATLIKQGDHAMLIDAGDDSKGSAVQLYLKKQGVEQLDYLVLTHTDSDHIGGADVIVSKFEIGEIFIGDFYKDKPFYSELMDAIEYRRMEYSVPEVGAEYTLGSASFTILAPNGTYDTPNNSGIALRLTNGEHAFLFSGDCEEQAEADILENGLTVSADVYKVAHHGSDDSSSKAFLEAVAPTYGVISCGEKNGYGHPHAEVLNHLRGMGVQVFRTDE